MTVVTERTYTPAEIAAAMTRAGFSADRLREGVAIVFAESGGRAEADNNNPGVEHSVGPWQINLLAHPDVSTECASDLDCSTQKAYHLSGAGASWAPWGAFTNGSYAKFLDLFTPDASTSLPDAAPASDAAGAASGSPSVDACASVPGSVITNVRVAMGNLLKVHTSPEDIANRLRQMYPNVAVACLQQIAYGAASSIHDAPDQQAVRNVQAAVSSLTKWTDLLKSENLWRIGIVAAGALAIVFGARLYLGTPEPAQYQGVKA